MKKIFFVLLFFSVIMSGTIQKEREVKAEEQYAEVLWANIYDSFEEMSEKADVILVGEVIDYSSLIEGGVVWTSSEIEYSKIIKGNVGETVSVVQFGGECGNLHTPWTKESPGLIMGEEYVLFLMKEEGENNYYYIMGPGQGCFIVDDSNSNVNIHSLMNYCSDKFEKYEANSKSRTLATPYNGFVWNKNTVKYQISSVNDPGNEIKNKIKSGLQVWNGFSSMVISEATSSQSYDIEIIVGTGFGECAGYADYIDTMKIYIYTNKFDTSNLSYWHRIAGHEMGHMLGLGHNETGASSIMNPKVVNMSGSPEYVDIIAIQGLYP